LSTLSVTPNIKEEEDKEDDSRDKSLEGDKDRDNEAGSPYVAKNC
jgi:hypothetical protein